jgi:hypothetical protein
MATLPYPIMQLRKETAYRTATDTTWQLFLHLKDTDNQKSQRETVLIYTQALEPADKRPQGLELAALRRVHALLGEQIAAMKSQ